MDTPQTVTTTRAPAVLKITFLKDLAGHAVEAEQEPGKKKKGGGKTVDTLFFQKSYLEI